MEGYATGVSAQPAVASLKDFLALAAKPEAGIKALLEMLAENALRLSASEVACIILNSAFCVPGTPSSDDPVGRRVMAYWGGRWVPAALNHAALASRPEIDEGGAEVLVQSLPGSPASRHADLSAVIEAPVSRWLPLRHSGRFFGWLGLAANRDNLLAPAAAEALQTMVGDAMVALQRMLFRRYCERRGMDVNVVGRSDEFIAFERRLKLAAEAGRGPVLIRGERGTGKELAAYACHFFSSRRDKPFVPVLGAALSDSLVIDELFGHEKSSFTGAAKSRKGKFQAADGGTIFLDEVGDLPPALQVALLRVIEYGEIQPVGRDLPVNVDVRIVAATNKNLRKMVEQGLFREDLYDRLNVFDLEIPPLRRRREDIPILANYFILRQCEEMGRRRRLAQDLLCARCQQTGTPQCATTSFHEALQAYDWPGNVREMQNLFMRLTAVSGEELFDLRHVPQSLSRPNPPAPLHVPTRSDDLSLHAAIEMHIRRVLALAGHNQTQASKLLGIPRTTLQAKMRRYNIRDEAP